MRNVSTIVLTLAFALSMTLSSCRSSDERLQREFTQGARIDHQIQDVWVATRSVMRGFGRGEKGLDSENYEAKAVIGGELVTVRLEEHSGDRTVIHVITKNADLAQEVLSSIQSMLPRSQ